MLPHVSGNHSPRMWEKSLTWETLAFLMLMGVCWIPERPNSSTTSMGSCNERYKAQMHGSGYILPTLFQHQLLETRICLWNPQHVAVLLGANEAQNDTMLVDLTARNSPNPLGPSVLNYCPKFCSASLQAQSCIQEYLICPKFLVSS